MANSSSEPHVFTPRQYQVEMLEKAMKKNIIVCLGTGSGKTFIAVMLIREMMETIKKAYKNGGKRTFFLAKTVPLVVQQATVIRQHTGLKVGHYTGSMNVDAWNIEMWKKEFEKNEVLVMTTQILVNILTMAYIKLSQINLLIFDECHHAVGGDPIVQVMERFKNSVASERPKVLGLTASVLNGKSKPTQILNKIRKLEATLHSVIETPSNTAMAAQFSTRPTELFVCFKEITNYDTLKRELVTVIIQELGKLESSPTEKDLNKFALSLEDDDSEDDGNYEDFKYIVGPDIKLTRVLRDLIFCIVELGLWCALVIAKQVSKELDKVETDLTTEKHFKSVKMCIEKLIVKLDFHFAIRSDNELDLMQMFSSHKITRLSEILLKYKPRSGNDFKAIIFVERKCTAWIINRYLQNLKDHSFEYNFINSEFVIGHGADPSKFNYAQMKSRKQAEKILKFRSKECNVLIGTRVIEEGMDIPTCNLVIRFDEPKDFRAYVQSKGRARAIDSTYVMLVKESEYKGLKENIELYRSIEEALQIICKDRMPPTEREIENVFQSEIPPFYPKDISGPVVTMYSASQLVNRYCSLLPKDKFTCLFPRVKFQKVLPNRALPYNDVNADDPDLWDDFDVLLSNVIAGEKYRCILWLPVNSPLRKGIKGDIMKTVKLAKRSVAMKTCQLLHACGELTDDLLPSCKDYSQFNSQLLTVKEEVVNFGCHNPGSLKRRQYYQKQVAEQLKSNLLPNSPCYLYLFEIKLSQLTKNKIDGTIYDTEDPLYNFGIITSTVLPKVSPFPMFTHNGKHWVELKELDDNLHLDVNELKKIELFNQKFFTNLLGINTTVTEFKPQLAEMKSLVIPIENMGCTSYPEYSPDWKLIEDVYNEDFDFLLPSEEERQQFQFKRTKFTDSIVVQLNLKKKVCYIVQEIMHGIHPSHPFPDETYKSFADYYRRKYQIEIQNMTQPLLSATKAIDSTLNMLSIKVERTRKKKTITIGGQKIENDILLVPELCYVLPMRAPYLIQGMMIPSIIYRLNNLLLAKEFSDTVLVNTQSVNISKFINCKWSNVEKKCRDLAIFNENNWEFDYKTEFGIEISIAEALPKPHVVLNALITRAANDCCDLERFEFLGDSFLKYVTTLYLFSEFPKAGEGKLTAGRGKMISNSHLYQLAKREGLANLVKTEIFSPTFQWIPPGFTTETISEAKLLTAGIPFNAWQFFAHYHLRNMSDGQIWSFANRKDNNLKKDEYVRNLAKYQLISDKSVADSVEAVLAVFLLYSGPEAALRFLVFLGFKILPVDGTPYLFPKTALIEPHNTIPGKLLAGLDDFENEIGYVFKDKSFLVQAFTHPSYNVNQVTGCYQRLEFLGDAILDYLITWNLFKDKRKFLPGQLTDIRSALVNNVTFATLAVKKNFNCHLKALSPQLFNAINKFLLIVEKEEDDTSILFEEDECLDEEEVDVPKVLGDIFESVAGAIYLDSGCSLDAVWNVYFKIMEPIISEYSIQTPKNPLREVFEKFPDIKFGKAILLDKENEDDPEKFSVTVKFGTRTFKGIGSSSKLAKLNAAKLILMFYKKNSKSLMSVWTSNMYGEVVNAPTLDEIFEMAEMEML